MGGRVCSVLHQTGLSRFTGTGLAEPAASNPGRALGEAPIITPRDDPGQPGITYSFREDSWVSALSRSSVLCEGGTEASSPRSGGPSRTVSPAAPAGRAVWTLPTSRFSESADVDGSGNDQGQGPSHPGLRPSQPR